MKAVEIITESRLVEAPKKGREFNHLEDLVFFYGSKGALEAADILEKLAAPGQDLSIKWDGRAALFYGRDQTGQFMMGTIGNWRKEQPATSADGMYEYILNTGKGEEWRAVMAKDLKQTFVYLEQSVPSNFRGFVKGDLIYSPVMIPVSQSEAGLQFTPNKVTYTVDPQSEIGQRVSTTKVGMALHVKYNKWNSDADTVISSDDVRVLNSSNVLTLGQRYASAPPELNVKALQDLRGLIKQNGAVVDSIIEKRQGLSDMSNIIYTFQNQTMRAGGYDRITTKGFLNWLGTSKVSANKQAKIQAMDAENPNAFPALFELINKVASVKNDIIDQLDATTTDVKTNIGDKSGGEGYVSLQHKIKLVPRHKWTTS